MERARQRLGDESADDLGAARSRRRELAIIAAERMPLLEPIGAPPSVEFPVVGTDEMLRVCLAEADGGEQEEARGEDQSYELGPAPGFEEHGVAA